MVCMVLYQPLLSSGSLGVTVIFSFSAESRRLFMPMVLLSILRYFSWNGLPSSVFAETIRRLLFLPCLIFIRVSGNSVISFSKPFLFFGSLAFCLSRSAPCRPLRLDNEFLSLASLASFLFFAFFLLLVLDGSFLNLSFAFFRNGTWL